MKLRSQSFYKDIQAVGSPKTPNVEGFNIEDYDEARIILKKLAILGKKLMLVKKESNLLTLLHYIPPERVFQIYF